MLLPVKPNIVNISVIKIFFLWGKGPTEFFFQNRVCDIRNKGTEAQSTKGTMKEKIAGWVELAKPNNSELSCKRRRKRKEEGGFEQIMFLFKKIFAPLLFPVSVCLEIMILGLYLLFFTKKQKTGKFIMLIGVLLFASLSYDAVSDRLLKPLEYQYPPLALNSVSDISSSAKWIVVLGGGHTSDPRIPVTSQISDESLVRLIEAIRLFKELPGCKLILSGGRCFDPVPEAETMASVAQAIGINRQDLVLEMVSRDTKDQAENIRSIVGNNKFILVTSASHMPRTIALFKKLGMDPIPAPTAHRVKEKHYISPHDFYPGSGALSKAERAVYEYLGIAWAKLRNQI